MTTISPTTSSAMQYPIVRRKRMVGQLGGAGRGPPKACHPFVESAGCG